MGLVVLLLCVLAVASGQRPRQGASTSSIVDELRRGGSLQKLFEDRTPDYGRLSPLLVGGSVMIPKGKELYCSTLAAIKLEADQRISFSLRSTGMEIHFSPNLRIDAIWPIRDVVVSSLRYEFGREVHVNVAGAGLGFIPGGQTKVKEVLTDLITRTVKGTPLSRRNYNVWRDRDVMGTLEKVMGNLPKEENSCRNAPTQAHLFGTEARITLKSNRGYKQDGLELEAGATLRASVELRGRLSQHLQGRSLLVEQALLNFQPSVLIKSLATVSQVTFYRGGRMSINFVSVLDGIRALGNLLQTRGLSAGRNRQAVGRDVVEREVADRVRAWIRDNRNILPGYDLQRILGTR